MEPNFLNYSWLKNLSNSNHDSSTEQIYGIASAFVTDNASYNNCVQALRTCRENQDAIWNRSQRDPAAAALRKADARMDAYIRAARYYIAAHAGLPADEPTVEQGRLRLRIGQSHTDEAEPAPPSGVPDADRGLAAL